MSKRPQVFRSAVSRTVQSGLVAERLESRQLLSVSISEFMARNESVLLEGYEQPQDWIELYNDADVPVNLAGWWLTDSSLNLEKWRFPDIEIGAKSYLLVFATSHPSDGDRISANFKLDADGEYLGLINAHGEVVQEFAPGFPRQFVDVAYGFDPVDLIQTYLGVPTPGRANVSSPYGPVADVAASHASGYYDEAIEVALSVETPNAIIRYTLDGSEPTQTSGVQYQVPVRVSRTTTLRATAFYSGVGSQRVTTKTFLFLDAILNQSTSSAVASGFPEVWGERNADYEMDRRVAGANGTDQFGGKYAATIRRDMVSLPAFSLVADRDDLFDAEVGIYANPTERGLEWERAASVELIDPSGAEPGFQIDAGVRLQGGITRFNSTKNGLRLIFRSQYGAPELSYPLYGDATAARFNSLVLRPASGEPDRQIIRDANLRATQRALGQVSPHGRFIHLYLNGLYWGVYEIIERPDQVFAANNFGGEPDEWDVVNGGYPDQVEVATAGTTEAWQRLVEVTAAMENVATQDELTAAYYRLQGRNADGTNRPEWETLLDVDNYIDYLITQWYLKNTDWPQRNFYFARLRGPESTGFKFFVWDGDFTVGSQGPSILFEPNRFGQDDSLGPGRIFPGLYQSQVFRARFRQRVLMHVQPGAALWVDPDNSEFASNAVGRNAPAERYAQISTQIDHAIVAESARWGDALLFGGGFGEILTRDEVWIPRIRTTIQEFFNGRQSEFLAMLERADLYDSNDSIPPPADVIITELNYHPAEPSDTELAAIPSLHDSDFEFVEMYNRGDSSVNLRDFSFADGIRFQFADITLGVGEFAVVVANRDAFALRYGEVASVVGEFEGGRLSNGGEMIELVDPFARTVVRFAYEDGGAWPSRADGLGSTLALPNIVDAVVADLGRASAWRASPETGGSPGAFSSLIGDSNRDGVFDSADFVTVFAGGKYESDVAAVWEDGDWNGDGRFDTRDLVLAFAENNFDPT